MPLASLEDINVHLPDDKLEVDLARYDPLQLDAERIVRGYLAGYVDAVTLATWSTPDATPELIRAIAGRLVAAFYYRNRYSEDSLDDPEYAKFKYDEAILWLTNIQMGTMTLPEVTAPIVSGINIDSSQFWPNDSTEAPVFTMDMNL